MNGIQSAGETTIELKKGSFDETHWTSEDEIKDTVVLLMEHYEGTNTTIFTEMTFHGYNTAI